MNNEGRNMEKYLVIYVDNTTGEEFGGIYTKEQTAEILINCNNFVIRCEQTTGGG